MLFAYPFRIFFVCTALFGAAAIAVWLAVLTGWLGVTPGTQPMLWHAHEMLYGFAPAAIAGFLLTAMSNWTGMPPPRGAPLLALALLWLAGRLAMAAGGVLPAWLVATVDVSFLVVLAAYTLIVLRRARNTRNLPLVGVLLVLASGNLLMHLSLMGMSPRLDQLGTLVALDTLALLMGIIAGRITPAFTRNWLAQNGSASEQIRVRPRLDHAALAATVLMLPADLIAPASAAAGVVALLAGALHLARLVGWRGWCTWRNPLLWVLHVGYGWLVLALLLKGLTPLLPSLPASAWYHALGIGAMGTLIVGVMTRVAVGHTGRPLTILRGAQLIYWLVTAAAILRLASATDAGTGAGVLHAAAAAWVAALLLFTVLYGPILNRPRADGKPG